MMIHRNMARRKNLAMKAVKVEKPVVEKPVEDKPVVEDDRLVVEGFTRDDVMKMPFMKLRSVAKKNGIDTENLDAREMRSTLIEKLGL